MNTKLEALREEYTSMEVIDLCELAQESYDIDPRDYDSIDELVDAMIEIEYRNSVK